MIRYTLRCDKSHAFESWFRDSGSFDDLRAATLVICPECGSAVVEKALMSPAVVTSRKRAEAPRTLPAAKEEILPPQQVASVMVDDEHADKRRAIMRQMRDHMIAQTKDVGPAFAVEARKIHDGDSEEKAIRGVASADEVQGLLEDGIDIMPIPVFPDDRN